MDYCAKLSDFRSLLSSGRYDGLGQAIKTFASQSTTEQLDSLLRESIRARNVPFVELVLANAPGVNVSPLDDVHGTPLHAAKIPTVDTAYQICKLLVDHGADLGIQDVTYKQTALYLACHGYDSDARLIELLLNEKSLRATNTDRQLPHHQAARAGNVVALKTLFAFEDRVSCHLSDAEVVLLAYQAVKVCSGDTNEVLRVIFDKYRDAIVRCELERPALLAKLIKHNFVQPAKVLLDLGVDPLAAYSRESEPPKTPLDAALTSKASPKSLSLLVSYAKRENVAPVVVDRSLRDRAMKYGSFEEDCASTFEQCKILLDAGFKLATCGATLQLLACERFLSRRHWIGYLHVHLIPYSHMRVLSLAILSDVDNAAVERVVGGLLAGGASASACSNDELPPLVALSLRIHEFNKSVDKREHSRSVERVLIMLLDHGADPFHSTHLNMVGIQSPDLVLVASLIGDMTFFFHLMTRVGFSASLLIQDFMTILRKRRVKNELARYGGRRVGIRLRLAAVAGLCLMLTANDRAVTQRCAEIDSLTGSRTKLARFSRKLREAARSAFDRNFHCGNGVIPPLQKQCRTIVCERLIGSPTSLGVLEAKIEKLSLPIQLKNYLKFDDITDDILERDFDAESVWEINRDDFNTFDIRHCDFEVQLGTEDREMLEFQSDSSSNFDCFSVEDDQ